jgi:hypothetical protein
VGVVNAIKMTMMKGWMRRERERGRGKGRERKTRGFTIQR